MYFCTEKVIYFHENLWISFSSQSRSVSETSSSASSNASISAKYALCFFTKSSGNLGVLGEGRFCSKLQAIRKVKIMDVVSNVFQIPERLKSRYPSRYFHIHTLCQCTFRPKQDNQSYRWHKQDNWSNKLFYSVAFYIQTRNKTINTKLEMVHMQFERMHISSITSHKCVTKFWNALHINISEQIHIWLVQRSMDDNASTQHQIRYQQMASFEQTMGGSKHNGSSLCRSLM